MKDTFAEKPPCRVCRKGPAFRLDVHPAPGRKTLYCCRYCGLRWTYARATEASEERKG